ncbi:MAG: lipid-A-disaccharide synthase [Candidatus Zixiibacteriota bacterium]
MGQPSLFVSAGDPSGDNAAGHLITVLKKQYPGLEFYGLGGPRLKKLGQLQLAESHDLAVLGFWEVARRYLFFRRLFFRCVEKIKTERPACVLLVDYPGFNLRLAEKIKPLGIPIVYYISPQVWAWGKGRLPKIEKLVDLMMYILPFEDATYTGLSLESGFVGHYLLEDIPSTYIKSPLPENRQIALLPGSRPQEIERMLPVMLKAAAKMRKKYGTEAVIAGVKDTFNYAKYLAAKKEGLRLSFEDSRKIIYESRLVLTSSGTATLETGIIGRPMVVIYKTGFVTYLIARNLVKLTMIGLVNLVQGEIVVPELIQGEASAGNIVRELERYLTNNDYLATVKGKLDRIPGILGGPGASERAARLVGRYL